MRIVDPNTGRSYIEKRRVRYNEPGQPRELTFPAIGITRSWPATGLALGFARRWQKLAANSVLNFGPT
jgi:hypothetical protein